MRIQVFILFLCFSGIGCSNNVKTKTEESKKKSNDNFVFNDNLIQICYGINTKVDTLNPLEMAMYYLEQSDYKKCINLIKSGYQIDTMWYSGFYGLQLSPNERQENIIKYILFEYENFLDNLPMEAQSILLLRAAFSPDSRLYKLQEIESKYIENNKNKNNEAAKMLINEASKLKEQFSGSKRLDFILAKEYLIIGEEQKAFFIYDQLISNNYYSLICLRDVIDYLSYKKNLVLKDKYVSILKQRFPDQCNIRDVSLSLSQESIYQICNQCIKSDFQKDSIKAKLTLAQYFLYTKNYKSLDSAINEYLERYTELQPDSFLLYERGMYFDLKMRSLFLQGKYSELCKFIRTELGYNLVININNNKEFQDYIKTLYQQYTVQEKSSFPEFFENNFGSCIDE